MRLLGLGLLAVSLCPLACSPFEQFEIAGDPLPDGQVGEPYTARIGTAGGHGNVGIRVLSGQLPPGIGFRQDERDGLLSGTPTLAGDFLFTIEARDSSSTTEPSTPTVVSQGFAVKVRSGLDRH